MKYLLATLRFIIGVPLAIVYLLGETVKTIGEQVIVICEMSESWLTTMLIKKPLRRKAKRAISLLSFIYSEKRYGEIRKEFEVLLLG